MTLFLTSAGMEVKEEILKILPKPPKQIKLAHVITASKVEKSVNYMLGDKRAMLKLSFQVEDIDIEGKNVNELKKAFKNKDIVYVQGGNTFYLLKHVKESGFKKAVKEFLKNGGIYIGASAGSYIACPTIEQATWKHQDTNIVKLKDLSALNLVPFLLTAHFEEKYRRSIEKGAQTTKYPVVALTDAQAILIKDGKWKLVGKGKKEYFNGFYENWQ